MHITDQAALGQFHRRSDRMLRRVRLLNARRMGSEGPATVHADEPPVVLNDSKKTVCGRVFEFVVLFLEQSSIHGLNHLVEKKRTFIERLVWGSAIVLAVFGTVWLSLDIWKRYNTSPTAISMERNFMDWATDLPSGTLCPLEKVDEDKLQAYVDSLKQVEDKEKVKTFLRRLANATYENFKDIIDIPNNPIRSDEYLNATLQIRRDLHYKCSNSESSWDPDSVIIVTELGICSTYNTYVAIYNNPEYWAQNNWSVIPYIKTMTLKGHPVSGPIVGNLLNIKGTAVMFFYHSPYDVLDASYTKYRVPENEILMLKVGALSTYTTAEARKLSIEQRKCRFPDENNLRISPVYTFNFCQMECRMQIARRKCKCIPHFYRKIGRTKTCDVQGMHCLGNYSELLTKLVEPGSRKRYPCSCLPECDQVSFFLDEEIKDKESVLSVGTAVQYGIHEYPRMRLKRNVIFGFSDLWVSIGGTGGLFLGCSVLSIIEIFYFFTIRLFIYILGICSKKQPMLQAKPAISTQQIQIPVTAARGSYKSYISRIHETRQFM